MHRTFYNFDFWPFVGLFLLLIAIVTFSVCLLINSIKLYRYTKLKIRGNKKTSLNYQVEIDSVKTSKNEGDFFEEEFNAKVENSSKYTPDALNPNSEQPE